MANELGTQQGTGSGTHTSGGEIRHGEAPKKRLAMVVIPLVALVLSAATYAVVWYGVPAKSWCHDLFFDRSWIQPANTFFFWVAITALAGRWLRHRREVEACEIMVTELAKPVYRDMNWQSAFVLADRLEEREFHKYRPSLVFSRVIRALGRLMNTQSTAEMREYLRIRGDIDSEELESSYANVRYLAWLIPTLGFVGTVLGISKGISSCGEIVQQTAIKGGGMPDISFTIHALGTAFDTTFLALVYSAIAVFFTSFLTKGEEQLLERIDHLSIDGVCGKFLEHSTINDGLMRRLIDMEEKLIDNVHGDRAELCRVIAKELPLQVGAALGNRLEKLEARRAEEVQSLLREMREASMQAGSSLLREMGGMGERLVQAVAEENRKVLDALAKIGERMQELAALVEVPGERGGSREKAKAAAPAGKSPAAAKRKPAPKANAGKNPPADPPADQDDPDPDLAEDDLATEELGN